MLATTLSEQGAVQSAHKLHPLLALLSTLFASVLSKTTIFNFPTLVCAFPVFYYVVLRTQQHLERYGYSKQVPVVDTYEKCITSAVRCLGKAAMPWPA